MSNSKDDAAPRLASRSTANVSIPLRDRGSWSVNEFAALHGLSVATIYRRAKEGAIQLSRFGGRTLITRQAAEAWRARIAAAADTKVAA